MIVWSLPQTTVISVDDIKQLIFIMQKHSVFREVEAAFLYIIYINLDIYWWVVPLKYTGNVKQIKCPKFVRWIQILKLL